VTDKQGLVCGPPATRAGAHAITSQALKRRQCNKADQINLKEIEKCQIRNGDIQEHGATGGVPTTT